MICHERKFIWFRVAKVGTRSVFNIFDEIKINLEAKHPMCCRYPEELYKIILNLRLLEIFGVG